MTTADLFTAAAVQPQPATAEELNRLLQIEALARVALGPGGFAEAARARNKLRVMLGLCTQQEADDLDAFMAKGGRP